MSNPPRKKAMISHGVASSNRRARYDYKIGETFEAGLMLVGPEVKSLRAGRATLSESWAGERDGELWLFNCTIPEWQAGSFMAKFEPRRPRKLLLHRKQVQELIGAITREGSTLVPIQIHFNERGVAKVLLGLAEGKKQHDKRATIADRDWKRDKARLMKEGGRGG